MIIGLPQRTVFDQVISEMHALPFEFFLTGSRAFECSTHASDWDFFTADDPDAEEQLIRLGFVRAKNVYYLDRETARVMAHGPAQIHVQMVNDTVLKRQAQEVMLLQHRGRRLSKARQRAAWNTVYDALRIK
jgi:hypothetical protein